jgi:hypothetical protein
MVTFKEVVISNCGRTVEVYEKQQDVAIVYDEQTIILPKQVIAELSGVLREIVSYD